MGSTCNTNGDGEDVYWKERQSERDHQEDQDVSEWTILRSIFEKWDWLVCRWIDLTKDKDGCRALVITVMNLGVPQNAGNFLSACITGDL
jgi:hypothetical protein